MSKIQGYGELTAMLVPFYVPSGVIDGNNVTFTLKNNECPVLGTAVVALDSLLISPTEFNLSNSTLILNTAPSATLLISYWIPN